MSGSHRSARVHACGCLMSLKHRERPCAVTRCDGRSTGGRQHVARATERAGISILAAATRQHATPAPTGCDAFSRVGEQNGMHARKAVPRPLQRFGVERLLTHGHIGDRAHRQKTARNPPSHDGYHTSDRGRRVKSAEAASPAAGRCRACSDPPLAHIHRLRRSGGLPPKTKRARPIAPRTTFQAAMPAIDTSVNANARAPAANAPSTSFRALFAMLSAQCLSSPLSPYEYGSLRTCRKKGSPA